MHRMRFSRCRVLPPAIKFASSANERWRSSGWTNHSPLFPNTSSGNQPSVAQARIHVEDFSAYVTHDDKILRKFPNALAFLSLRFNAFSQCFVEVAQPLLASGEFGFGTLALGNFLGSDIDPDDVPGPVFQWMPVCDPNALHIRSVGPLAVDFDTGTRFARTQDRLYNTLNLLGDLRNRLATERPIWPAMEMPQISVKCRFIMT